MHTYQILSITRGLINNQKYKKPTGNRTGTNKVAKQL